MTESLSGLLAEIRRCRLCEKHLPLGPRPVVRAAAPARVLALILSDVIDDPLDVIASGPVSPDPTTFGDAVEVLRRFAVWNQAPAAVREHLQRGRAGQVPESTDASDPVFAGVEAHVVGALGDFGERHAAHLCPCQIFGDLRLRGDRVCKIVEAARTDGGLPDRFIALH